MSLRARKRREAASFVNDLRVEKPATSGSAMSRSLPPELAAEASWRLGWLGLIYAGGYAAVHFGARFLLALANGGDVTPRLQDVFSLIAVAMGMAVYVVSRRHALPPKQLLNLGLGFQVAGAFGIAINEFWEGFPQHFTSSITFIPAECVWIVAFPLIVPNTPGKVLVSSLLAASTAPVALAISAAVTGRPVDRPLAVAVYFLGANYLSAGVAYAVSRIVHRFTTRLHHARKIGSYELVELIGRGGMGEVGLSRASARDGIWRISCKLASTASPPRTPRPACPLSRLTV